VFPHEASTINKAGRNFDRLFIRWVYPAKLRIRQVLKRLSFPFNAAVPDKPEKRVQQGISGFLV
jgi:hypothetical protein